MQLQERVIVRRLRSEANILEDNPQMYVIWKKYIVLINQTRVTAKLEGWEETSKLKGFDIRRNNATSVKLGGDELHVFTSFK